jgi:hypothetical protein
MHQWPHCQLFVCTEQRSGQVLALAALASDTVFFAKTRYGAWHLIKAALEADMKSIPAFSLMPT